MPSIMLGVPIQFCAADIAIILRLAAKQVIKLIRHVTKYIGPIPWSKIQIATPAEPLIVLRNPFQSFSAMWARWHTSILLRNSFLLICHDLSSIFSIIISLINMPLSYYSELFKFTKQSPTLPVPWKRLVP